MSAGGGIGMFGLQTDCQLVFLCDRVMIYQAIIDKGTWTYKSLPDICSDCSTPSNEVETFECEWR